MASFDDCFEKLFELTTQVLKYDSAGEMSIKTSNIDPIGSKVRKYRSAYGKTKSSEHHLRKFQDIYEKCQRKYLECEDFDEFMLWFEKQNYMINATNAVSFPLTIIFRKCCVISRASDENARKEETSTLHIGSTFPEQFMLHLFRIFMLVASKEDQEKIQETISNLEQILGLASGENPEPFDSLSEFVGMTTDVMSDMGINVPKSALSSFDFKKALGEFSRNPSAKTNLRKMFKGIKLGDKGDLPEAFKTIISKMQDNVTILPEPLERSLKASVENPTGEEFSVASSSG